MAKQWCERHWAVIRDDESINGIHASILLMQAFINKPGVAEEAGGKAEKLNEIMGRHSPVCCWLGEDAMQAIYAEAKMPPKPQD